MVTEMLLLFDREKSTVLLIHLWVPRTTQTITKDKTLVKKAAPNMSFFSLVGILADRNFPRVQGIFFLSALLSVRWFSPFVLWNLLCVLAERSPGKL